MAAAVKVHWNELFDQVCKLCGIEDTADATGLTLTVRVGELPRIELTRLVLKSSGDPEPVTQKFRVEPLETARTRFGPQETRRAEEPPCMGSPQPTGIMTPIGHPVGMDFFVTTNRRDRDSDILESKGISVAPFFDFMQIKAQRPDGMSRYPLPLNTDAEIQERQKRDFNSSCPVFPSIEILSVEDANGRRYFPFTRQEFSATVGQTSVPCTDCPDCHGTRIYQPLVGAAEPCKTCCPGESS